MRVVPEQKRLWQPGQAKHGMSQSRLYCIYGNMKARCYYPKNDGFHLYGGRGITVCEEWKNSFEAFMDWALANGYRDDLSIDRYPDQDGNYEPSNCRWATQSQQGNNQRRNHKLTAFGETKTVTEWSADERCSVPSNTLLYRIRRGWDTELAIVTPEIPKRASYCLPPITAFGETKTSYQWSRDPRCAVALNALRTRIRRGWDAERAIVELPTFNRKRGVA